MSGKVEIRGISISDMRISLALAGGDPGQNLQGLMLLAFSFETRC
jgi:hypothetical protein